MDRTVHLYATCAACLFAAAAQAAYLVDYLIHPSSSVRVESWMGAALVSVFVPIVWLPLLVYVACAWRVLTKAQIATALGSVSLVVVGTLIAILPYVLI